MIYYIFIIILYVYIFDVSRIRRTSKAQALQNMKIVLPTPKTKRLQQNLESDWTPGSYISQEEVSFTTPAQPDQAHCFCDQGYDIQAARDMRDALLERPVKGVTAAVCEVNEKQRTINVFKITHFSAYHNFEFGSGGIRARKAYSVGEGTSLTYSDILRSPQGPTYIVIKKDLEFFFRRLVRKMLFLRKVLLCKLQPRFHVHRQAAL